MCGSMSDSSQGGGAPGQLRILLDETLHAEVVAIGPLVDRIMEIVRATKSAMGKEDAVELALTEALTNAVVHGCKKDPSKTVRVVVGRDEAGGLVMVVRDSGDGFDPASLPNPLGDEKLLSAHGRGVFLINTLMDDVRFGDRGREIRMRTGPDSTTS